MTSKKEKTISVSKSSSQLFELIPSSTHTNPYYKQVKVEYSLPLRKSKSFERALTNQWPTFNKDGLYYTPAFVIPEDLAVLSLVGDCLKDQHLKKLVVHTEPSTKASLASLNMPHPEEQNYCGVCKSSYSNFEQHIDSNKHKAKCLTSPFTKHIYKFCNDYFPSKVCSRKENASKKKSCFDQSIRKNGRSQNSEESQNNIQPKCIFQNLQSKLAVMGEINQNMFELELTPPVRRRRAN